MTILTTLLLFDSHFHIHFCIMIMLLNCSFLVMLHLILNQSINQWFTFALQHLVLDERYLNHFCIFSGMMLRVQ